MQRERVRRGKTLALKRSWLRPNFLRRKTHTTMAGRVVSTVSTWKGNPVCSYEMIEQVSFHDYLELFARQARPGWTAIGNEVDGKDINQSLESLGIEVLRGLVWVLFSVLAVYR